jgi:hypothetical protein
MSQHTFFIRFIIAVTTPLYPHPNVSLLPLLQTRSYRVTQLYGSIRFDRYFPRMSRIAHYAMCERSPAG